MLPGSPTALANSGSMWIGLKSPEAPAYRCGRYLSGVTFSSGMESPSFSSLSSGISDSSDDVGPGSLDGLLPVLVGGDRLEDVEPLAVLLVDLLARRRRLDHVAIADRLVPLELLRAVQHRGEVDPDSGIEDGRPHRAGAVDDAEHRRGDQVAEPGRLGRIVIAMDVAPSPDRVRELADLLGTHLVAGGWPLLPDGVGLERHERRAILRAA